MTFTNSLRCDIVYILCVFTIYADGNTSRAQSAYPSRSLLTDEFGKTKSRPTSALASFPPTLCRIPEPILITAEDVEDGETVEPTTEESNTTPDYSRYFINFDPNKCNFIFKHLHYVIIM